VDVNHEISVILHMYTISIGGSDRWNST